MPVPAFEAGFLKVEFFGAQDSPDEADQLADLLARTEEIEDFLDGLARLGARVMSRSVGTRIECAVTLDRHKRVAAVGGSSGRAMLLDRVEQALEQGPCIDALDSGQAVLLEDALTSPLWKDYCAALSAAGMRSTLGVPLELGQGASAVLNFFARSPGTFTSEGIGESLRFGSKAGKALRLAVRISALNDAARNLRAAAESRSVIDRACGVIISQNRCSHEEAFSILRKASNDRNEKLRDIARGLVDGVGSRRKN